MKKKSKVLVAVLAMIDTLSPAERSVVREHLGFKQRQLPKGLKGEYKGLTIRHAVRKHLHAGWARHYKDIAEEIGGRPDSVATILSNCPEFVSDGRGWWTISRY